jgi:hypothetical protein
MPIIHTLTFVAVMRRPIATQSQWLNDKCPYSKWGGGRDTPSNSFPKRADSYIVDFILFTALGPMACSSLNLTCGTLNPFRHFGRIPWTGGLAHHKACTSTGQDDTEKNANISFRTESITKYMLTTINTRWGATQRVMVTKPTRLTHKIAIQLHLLAESCTICSSHFRWPVRKRLVTLSYIHATSGIRSHNPSV